MGNRTTLSLVGGISVGNERWAGPLDFRLPVGLEASGKAA